MSVRYLLVILVVAIQATVSAQQLRRFEYNDHNLTVDLGGGLYAWPLPMDYDGDGDYDLVVSSPDAIENSLLLFENPGGDLKLPVFKAPFRLSATVPNLQISYVDGKPRVLGPNVEYQDFTRSHLSLPDSLPLSKNIHSNPVRANQWKYVDFDGDGILDLVVAVEDWTEYGWDDAFDQKGNWTRGPLHGFIYQFKNRSTNESPDYAKPEKLATNEGVIDVYGMPSPNFADFDGDGDLDLLCGEFVDKLKYFENVGTRTKPIYNAGRFLRLGDELLKIDCCMFVPVALDWDKDGDFDLIIGQEDGRAMFCEHTGRTENGLPVFFAPQFFKQKSADVKLGVLATPTSHDWDGDGDHDIVAGDASGRVGWFENNGGSPPRWSPVEYLQADGEEIRIQADENGSIQGPCESKWGYTVVSVADWDNDGLPDLMLNSIWGKVVWYRNVGIKDKPKLTVVEPVRIDWEGEPCYPAWNWWRPDGDEFACQWRSSVQPIDINQDGHLDLVAIDHEGFLACYLRVPSNEGMVFKPGSRVFCSADQRKSAFDQSHRQVFSDENNDGRNDFVDGVSAGKLPYVHITHFAGQKLFATKYHERSQSVDSEVESKYPPLRLSVGWAGQSGRRQFCFTDWDGDGKLDLLVNSINVNFLRNISDKPGEFLFEDMGPVSKTKLAGHTTCPTVITWDVDKSPELIIGAEDGYFYRLLKHPQP